MDNRVSIVMYHYVREIEKSKYPGIKGLEYSKFVEQMEFFKKNFNVIRMEQLLAARRGEEELPERAVLLTFDDGYVDHYQKVYPLLHEMGLQGSFFMPSQILMEDKVLDSNKIHFILATKNSKELLPIVYKKLDQLREEKYEIESNALLFMRLASNNRWDTKETIFIKRLLQNYLPERLRNRLVQELFDEVVKVDEKEFVKQLYLNQEQIDCMKRNGMFFGLHGHTHSWMDKLDWGHMKEEIATSREFFKDIIDQNEWVMNYPYGAYDKSLQEYIKTQGCALALSVEPRQAIIGRDDWYALPRYDTNDFPPISDNYLSLV